MNRDIVQFPHPSQEHRPGGTSGVMPWNTSGHRRKFLRSNGTALDDVGRVQHGDFVFWGEWESESRYIRLERRPAAGLPGYLHTPFWREPCSDAFRQNTDPYVFGDAFRYSNCKQLVGDRPSGLQRLAIGSVLLFGGTRDEHFFVDTVFVVAERMPWSVHATVEVPDETLRRVTCDSVGTDRSVTSDFTLYTGATPDSAVDGMFSFTPCLPYTDDGAGFVRPVIALPGIVNGRSKQAPKRTPVDAGRAREAWESVVDQVRDQELLLGTQFKTPPRED